MRIGKKSAQIHGTTVLCVRKDNKVVLTADGQVTLGEGVIKHSAKKTRRLLAIKLSLDSPVALRMLSRFSPVSKTSFRNTTETWQAPRSNLRRNGARSVLCAIWTRC